MDGERLYVTLEFVGGPADGASFKIEPHHLEPGELVIQTRDGHRYQSRGPYDGSAQVWVFDRGKIAARKLSE